MPNRPATACNTPGCGGSGTAGRCPTCTERRSQDRERASGTPRERGYDRAWDARRLHYLTRNPWCALCKRVATVADHWPVRKRRLVALGVLDPDADQYLRPLCDSCHRIETARWQPGGWHQEIAAQA